jgi:hypothetical protein
VEVTAGRYEGRCTFRAESGSGILGAVKGIVRGLLALMLLGCGEEPVPRLTPVSEPAEPRVERPTPPTGPTPPTAPAQSAPTPAPPDVAIAELTLDDARRQTRLPTGIAERIRRELTDEYDAEVELRTSLYLRASDGSGTVFAITENSAWEACVNGGIEDGETRGETTERCRGELYDNIRDAEVPCTNTHLVRIELAAPSSGRGQALAVAAEEELDQAGCTLDAVRGFALRDVDADGKLELEVDLIGVDAQLGSRAAPFRVRKRTLGYYTDDLVRQFRETLTSVGGDPDDESDDLWTAVRVRLADENGDGHADLVFDRVTYETWPNRGCHEDEIGWPRVTQRPQRRCSGAIGHLTWLYDPARDEWSGPPLEP